MLSVSPSTLLHRTKSNPVTWSERVASDIDELLGVLGVLVVVLVQLDCDLQPVFHALLDDAVCVPLQSWPPWSWWRGLVPVRIRT